MRNSKQMEISILIKLR